MPVRSTKTTTAGAIAALALTLVVISDVFLSAEGGWENQHTGMVIAAVAVGLQGFFARDDNVTSEGTKRRN